MVAVDGGVIPRYLFPVYTLHDGPPSNFYIYILSYVHIIIYIHSFIYIYKYILYICDHMYSFSAIDPKVGVIPR